MRHRFLFPSLLGLMVGLSWISPGYGCEHDSTTERYEQQQEQQYHYTPSTVKEFREEIARQSRARINLAAAGFGGLSLVTAGYRLLRRSKPDVPPA